MTGPGLHSSSESVLSSPVANRSNEIPLLPLKSPDDSSEREVTIRFIPCHPTENRNFTSRKFYRIYYQNSIYAEQSLLDKGEPDPIYEYVDALHQIRSEHINAGNTEEAERIRKLIGTSAVYRHNGLKPLCEYYSNVMVIEDKQFPDNEGKVFVYKFNKWIWKMLKDLKNNGFNCFNLYEAPIFKFHTKTAENRRIDYLDTGFITDEIYSISSTKDGALDIINNYTYLLFDLGIRKEYKSYDELKTLFIKFMGKSYYENLGIPIPNDSIIYNKPSNSSIAFSSEIKKLRDSNIKNVVS